ncbi:MAG: sulfotransferase family 2 domain-containing protein [Candidatus Competibacteraceae bacterium]|nr:sulfotransferase family 2 domain-containing protein [Candidatus Competibacteraceae bacterium]
MNNGLLNDQSQLVFMHIPKAAGTTLTSILDSHYESSQICPAYYMRELMQIPINQINKYQLIRGHFEYSICKLLDNPICMTMLRDPIQRVISHYLFIRSSQTHALHKKFQSMSIMDMLNDPNEIISLTNHQTLYFGRNLNLDLLKQNLAAKNPISQTQHTTSRVIPKSNMNLELAISLELAMSRLKDLAFIGITEQFKDSLLLMSYTFGWAPVKNYESRNITPKKEGQIINDFEVVDAITEINKLDLSLYAFAQDLFKARVNEMKLHIADHYNLDDIKLLNDEMIIAYLDKQAIQ